MNATAEQPLVVRVQLLTDFAIDVYATFISLLPNMGITAV
jgi:hypothetical protein